MARSLPEWIGASDDTPVPPRVRLRVWERFSRCCGNCTRPIAAGDAWECDHRQALINGGENRESNLWPLCRWCVPDKNAADVAEKAANYRARRAHAGVKARAFHRPMACGRRSRWSKPIGSFRPRWRTRMSAKVRATLARRAILTQRPEA
jgi:hypothetical protein